MPTTWKQLRDRDTDIVLAARLEMADTSLKRTIGLMGRASLDPGSGIWLAPCNGIHTFFMLFPIDCIFLDRNGVVIRVVEQLRPWRICGPFRDANAVIELRAGTARRLNVAPGARLAADEITPSRSEES